jgi:hypothetical protein
MSEEELSRAERNEVFTASDAARAGHQVRNIMRDDFNFEVPVESVPLPSMGAVYSSDSPLFRQETIDIRAMTAKEEDILTSRALIKKGTVITHLLKSCMINKHVDPDEMLSGDRNALMTAVRITGYGAEYAVEVECPACSEKSKQAFDLAQLPIRRLKISPVAEGANLFEYILPVSKKRVRFKFLTGADEAELATVQERKKKQGMSTDNLVTQRLMFSIQSIDNITDKTKISMFIRNMPARDSLELRKFIDANEPGIEMKSWMDCPSCLEHSEVRLPIGAAFFWPDSDR